MLNFDQIYTNQVLTDRILPKYSMKNIGIWYLSKILEIWAKNVKGGSVKVEIFGGDIWDPCEKKNLKRAFLTVAPFIVKFRFEKYRYLLTHLLCLQIFEVLLSDKHSTGPRNGRLVPLPVACLVWWYSFRPQIYDESETDQILNAKYFVWKNYTLGKWGLREAFNQNSLMQLFNGDRRIVQWMPEEVNLYYVLYPVLNMIDIEIVVDSIKIKQFKSKLEEGEGKS